MSTISARPAALIAYGDELLDRDGGVAARVPTVRAALARYAMTCPDYGQDHTGLLDELGLLAHAAIATDLLVGRVGRAVDAADEGLIFAGGFRVTTDAAFDRAFASAGVLASDPVRDLRPLLRDLPADVWLQLVHGDLVGPHASWYAGAGGVIGPDGRIYPLVIPQMPLDGRVVSLSHGGEGRDVWNLGGTDPGWHLLSVVEGVTRVADRPGRGERAAVFLGFLAGLDVEVARLATPAQLRAVSFDRSGIPALGAVAAVQPHLPAPPAFPDESSPQRVPVRVDGQLLWVDPSRIDEQSRAVRREFQRAYGPGPYTPAPRGGRLPSRATVEGTAGAVDLLAGGLRGADVAGSLDDANHRAYQLRFETHPDGRRRATLTAAQMAAGEDRWILTPQMGYVADGELVLTNVHTALDPTPSIRAAPDPDAPPALVLHDPPVVRRDPLPRGGTP